jgi:DNA topoisomerase-1
LAPTSSWARGEKPKRSSLPKGWTPASLDLDRALKLINLPREVGLHPEDRQPITAAIGATGPTWRTPAPYANLETVEDVFEVGLNRAVALLAEKRAGGGRGQRASAAPLKDLGAHPETAAPVQVMSGRYGPYVKSGGVNATLPKGADPAELTMEQAVALLAERAGKPGGKPARGKKPAAGGKSAPKRKAPAKQAAKA